MTAQELIDELKKLSSEEKELEVCGEGGNLIIRVNVFGKDQTPYVQLEESYE